MSRANPTPLEHLIAELSVNDGTQRSGSKLITSTGALVLDGGAHGQSHEIDAHESHRQTADCIVALHICQGQSSLQLSGALAVPVDRRCQPCHASAYNILGLRVALMILL